MTPLKTCLLSFLLAAPFATILTAQSPATTQNAVPPQAKKQRAETTKLAFPRQLSMRQAKKIALRDNPTLKVTAARVKAAVAKVRESRGRYLPSIDLNTTGARQIDTARQDRNVPHRDAFSTFNSSVDATWTLFDGLAREYQILTDQLSQQTAQENHRDAQRRLLAAVAQAYNAALLERQNVLIAVDDFKYNKELQENAEKRRRHGKGTKSDVLNFEIQAEKADADKVMAEMKYQTAILALAELLCVDPATVPADPVVCLKELKLDPVKDYLSAPQTKPYPELCLYALENRPDLKASTLAVKRSEAQVKLQEAEYLPSVQAFASYGFRRNHDLDYRDVNDEAQVGLRLSWNIFNGGQTQARIARLVANRMAEEANRKSLLQEIFNDIATHLNVIAQAKKLADLKNNTQKLAKQARDLVKKEYENGRVTATRLNEAQTDLTTAQGAYYKAVINYWQYRENLNAATAEILILE